MHPWDQGILTLKRKKPLANRISWQFLLTAAPQMARKTVPGFLREPSLKDPRHFQPLSEYPLFPFLYPSWSINHNSRLIGRRMSNTTADKAKEKVFKLTIFLVLSRLALIWETSWHVTNKSRALLVHLSQEVIPNLTPTERLNGAKKLSSKCGSNWNWYEIQKLSLN